MVVTTVQKGDHATDSVKAADHAQWNFVPPEVRAKIKPPAVTFSNFNAIVVTMAVAMIVMSV